MNKKLKMHTSPCQKQHFNIVYMTNESYLFQTYVSISSLKMNKHHNISYDVYLLCIEMQDIGDIKKLNDEDFCIHPIYIERNIYRYDANAGVVYYKMILHELLDVDTVFHIDSDTVVIDDVSSIFDYNLTDYFCGGVKDKIKGLKYFNAGNVLLNLKKIRETLYDNEYTMYDYFWKLDKELRDKKGFLWEQDVFNKAFENKILYINYGYNFLVNTYSQYKFNDLSRIYGEKVDYKKIKILHFASHPKPWIKANLFGEIWKMYAENKVNKELEQKILRVACREH